MGFDFYIIDSNGDNGDIVDELYLSYNWSDLEKYWYIRRDLFGNSTEDAAEKLEKVIKKLNSEGFAKADPNNFKNFNSWGWGVDNDGNKLHIKERMSVYIYHLDYILQTCKRNSGCKIIDSDDYIYEKND